MLFPLQLRPESDIIVQIQLILPEKKTARRVMRTLWQLGGFVYV